MCVCEGLVVVVMCARKFLFLLVRRFLRLLLGSFRQFHTFNVVVLYFMGQFFFFF